MADSLVQRARTVTRPLIAGALVAGLALLTFFAFDAWLRHGADIVFALSAGGLSWCF